MNYFIKTTSTFVITGLLCSALNAQTDRRDKATFKPRSNEFYELMKKGNQAFSEQKPAAPLVLRMDHSGIDAPKSTSEFKTIFYQKPESQGEAGTCWCFSTTSFYESEIKRLTNQDIQLSELFTVYWQYVEKAKEFVRTRGT
jgi:bleomycin hydrolase